MADVLLGKSSSPASETPFLHVAPRTRLLSRSISVSASRFAEKSGCFGGNRRQLLRLENGCLMQMRMIKVGNANLECTLGGLGDAVVLLANAGCSTNYFGCLASRLIDAEFAIVGINMRGVGRSTGQLEGISLHDLAADVAGVIEALGCAPAHMIGHAFGNRVARCLAADRPELVCSVILLAAGGLIGPPTPLGSAFRDAGDAMRSGPDCAALVGSRPPPTRAFLRQSNAGRRCTSPKSLRAVTCRLRTGGPLEPRRCWLFRVWTMTPRRQETAIRCAKAWERG